MRTIEFGSLLHRRLVNRAVREFTEVFGDLVPTKKLVFELTTLDPAELVENDLHIRVNDRAVVIINLSLVSGVYDDEELAHDLGRDCERFACTTCQAVGEVAL